MKSVVIAFNYVEFKDKAKKSRQDVALSVLKKAPSWVFPVCFGFENGSRYPEQLGFYTFNMLRRNAMTEIGNDRELPYIYEIMDLAATIECDKIGYVNSDILLKDDFYNCVKADFDAFIFSRYDIVDVNSDRFLNNDFRVIYGGDTHAGADGFFFKREWWKENRNKFPDNLIIGETEWDTCYRKLIKKNCYNYIEKRLLYHVYHDQKWNLTSNGAKNNIKIWEAVRRDIGG